MFFTGCAQEVMYSEKYEGVPIYPGVELQGSTEYIEDYGAPQFSGTFEEVKEFYMKYIDQERWSIEENLLHENQENDFMGFQGYILKDKDKEREISLILEWVKTKDNNGPLRIIINGSPLKEGKYKVKGESTHWNASLEYSITKGGTFINGQLQYMGDIPPQKVAYHFMMYQVIKNKKAEEAVSTTAKGSTLKDSTLMIVEGSSGRNYKLEILKEAINNGYIELTWEAQGQEKTEKINLAIVP